MKLKHVTLENFRGFKKLELTLDPQLTVLVGANGAGKSSVLDAIAILLSRITSRVRGGAGRRDIRELDIRNKSSFALIKAQAVDETLIDWQVLKVKPGHLRPEVVKENDSLGFYTKTIQKNITENENMENLFVSTGFSIPTFAYYPINRAVLDIPLRIRRKHTFSQLEAWDESLTSAANFRSFFEWFREREDLENEKTSKTDYTLNAVRAALEKFLPDYSGISVRRSPLRMVIKKHDKEMRVDQLSDGEKNIIALIGDIARRLVIANDTTGQFFDATMLSSAENIHKILNDLSQKLIMESEGVILIDEIDLHLHPAWQRQVLPKLMETFPNCQFIVSTHSPQILGEVDASQIRILSQDENNEIHCHIPQQAKGLTSNEVLNELMSWDGSNLARNTEVEEQLDTLFKLIDDEDFVQAKAQIAQMKTALHGSLPDIVQAEALMSMMETDLVDDTK